MVKKSDLYKVDGDKIERKNPICPRCGEGVFMADHGDRFVLVVVKVYSWLTMVTDSLVVNADTLK